MRRGSYGDTGDSKSVSMMSGGERTLVELCLTRAIALYLARNTGRRYTTLDLLNITTRGLDDDGKSSGQKRPEEKAPAGYDPWFATLEGLADSGEKAFNVGFEKSPPEFRTYLARTAPKTLAALKNRARGRS